MRQLVRTASVAAVALATVMPGIADAAGPVAQSAHFSVSLRGSQATTWHTEKVGSAVTCGSSIVGDGDQMIRFHSHVLSIVGAGVQPPDAPRFDHGIPVLASVERGAEFRTRIPIFDPATRRCRGTRTLPPTQMPGCGKREGTLSVLIGFTPSSVGGTPPDETLAELSRPNELRLRGVSPDFGGGSLRTSFSDCELAEPDPLYPPSAGELFEAVAHLSEKRLISIKPGGQIRLSASKVAKFRLSKETRGQTIVTYNLVLRRLSQ